MLTHKAEQAPVVFGSHPEARGVRTRDLHRFGFNDPNVSRGSARSIQGPKQYYFQQVPLTPSETEDALAKRCSTGQGVRTTRHR